jgi:hypothetical protein
MGVFKQKVLFTKKECENIVKTYNCLPITGSMKNQNSAYMWRTLDKKTDDWILNRIINWISDEVEYKIQWDNNKDTDEFYFQSYKKGDKFGKHDDNIHNRVYTIGVLLNNKFKGGNFLVDVTPHNSVLFENIIGNCYLMESNLKHELEEITDGERHIILVFLKNSQIKFVNKFNGLSKVI